MSKKTEGNLIFILGGARSGKSTFAEELAESLSAGKGLKDAGKLNKDVVYVAACSNYGDEEMSERIEKHKNKRPKEWKTLEIGKISDICLNIRKTENSVIIIECLTILISNLLFESHKKITGETEESAINKISDLIMSIKKSNNIVIVVSNEVGGGIVPENKLARKYRDILGKGNQLMAKNADEFYVMFAGIPVKIKASNTFDNILNYNVK